MFVNAFLLAVREIRRNVLRSFLTILGVVIGVAAVVTLVTVGGGVTAKVAADMSKLGTNILVIMPGQFRGPGGGSSDAKPFQPEHVASIRREVSGLAGVAPSITASGIAVYGNTNWSTMVRGGDNDFFTVKDWTLAQGRTFSTRELRTGLAVCIIGATVRQELFGDKDPIGDRIRFKNISFQVIGLLAGKGTTGMGTDQDDIIIVPLATCQRRITGSRDIRMIEVKVRDGAGTSAVQADIESLLRERRRIGPDEDDDFRVHDMTEMVSTMQSTTKVLTTLLGAVAAVSLLVGGIGIMNIMLVSVTERTREIGTRLAIGALDRDVMVQFLVEAMALSSLGGVIGLLLAAGGSYVLVKVLSVPLVFNAGINVLAFLFSAAVGMVFGFFPARKAARLDPIEALRYE